MLFCQLVKSVILICLLKFMVGPNPYLLEREKLLEKFEIIIIIDNLP